MKKAVLAAVIIVGLIFVFFYKVGEDMESMTRCGCRVRF